MKVLRTVRVKLQVPCEKEVSLHETINRFRYCSNKAAEWAWADDGKSTVSKAKAEQAIYRDLKAETGLHANLVQKAIKRAIDAVK